MSGRLRAALVGACILHTFAASWVARRPLADTREASHESLPVEIELESDVEPSVLEPSVLEPSVLEPSAPSPAAEAQGSLSGPSAPSTAPPVATHHDSTATGTNDPTDVITAPAEAQGSWSFSAFRAPTAPSAPTLSATLGGLTAPQTEQTEQSEQTDRAARSAPGRMLARELDKRDAERGLGRGGAVLSSAERIVRADTTVQGRARYEAFLDSDGTLRVSVIDASEGRAAWDKLAQSIARSIDVRRLRLPQGARWRAVVEVEAQLRYPNGTLASDVGKVTAKASGGKLRANPSIEDLPGVSVAVRGKVCSVGASAGAFGVGVGGGCDLTNAMASATRQVRGRIVEEERL